MQRLAVGALAITLAGCSFASIDRDNAEVGRSFLWLGWATQDDEDRLGDLDSHEDTILISAPQYRHNNGSADHVHLPGCSEDSGRSRCPLERGLFGSFTS